VIAAKVIVVNFVVKRVSMHLQFAAESAYDMVSPGPSRRVKQRMTRRPPRRFAQPVDLREGVSNAVNIITGVSVTSTYSNNTGNNYQPLVAASSRLLPPGSGIHCVTVISASSVNLF